VKAREHMYKLPPNCPGETDYLNALETIIRFLHPMEKLPIFFCEGDELSTSAEEIQRIVTKIFYEAQEDDVIEDLKFYPVSEVFFMLKKVATMNHNRLRDEKESAFPSVMFAADKMKNTMYKHTAEGCEYHNGL
jgi:hypothetical protein